MHVTRSGRTGVLGALGVCCVSGRRTPQLTQQGYRDRATSWIVGINPRTGKRWWSGWHGFWRATTATLTWRPAPPSPFTSTTTPLASPASTPSSVRSARISGHGDREAGRHPEPAPSIARPEAGTWRAPGSPSTSTSGELPPMPLQVLQAERRGVNPPRLVGLPQPVWPAREGDSARGRGARGGRSVAGRLWTT